MKFWIRYIKEKRLVLCLYGVTVFLLVAVGCLYHIENLYRLLYGVVMTLAVWTVAGILQGRSYVRKCKDLESAARLLEGSGDYVPGEICHVLSRWETGENGTENTLEGDLAGLVRTLCDNQAREQSRWEEKATDRNDYYMMWTHQIKTPIAALKLLLEGNENVRDGFLMREELFKIEQYVEMVLTFQRLESLSSDLVLQEYELGAILRRTAKKFSILFINKGLALELPETKARVLTDEKWFGFCLEQLFSNSIKYTRQGKIAVYVEECAESVRLELEDTGIGIRPEDLPQIFEKGFTGYNGRMNKKSTGIGLYLCRRIFDHLSIRVNVESQEGKGTRASMELPVKRLDMGGL